MARGARRARNAADGDQRRRGEPGTFKDRYYLETDPHRFIEGMLIGAHVVEASDIHIYIRDEYPASREILEREIAKLPAAAGAAYAARRRRLTSRRGIVAARKHRGQAAACPGTSRLIRSRRAVRIADTDQQCRDTVGGCATSSRRRGTVEEFRPQRPPRLAQLSVSGRVKNPGMKLAHPASRCANDRRVLRRHGRRP